MHDYLVKILDEKKKEVSGLRNRFGRDPDFQAVLAGQYLINHTGDFKQALCNSGLSVIAEIKRRSPSKQHLAEIADPVSLAKIYEAGGAAAISVLTDQYGFSGSIDDLAQVSSAVKTPTLRKDFIIDELQIAQAILHGAKAVLLIVAVLGDKTARFIKLCQKMGIDALVEIHDEAELSIAISAGAQIIGVNNRNLSTFEVDINRASILKKLMPDNIITVAESGIHEPDVAHRYYREGFSAVLIGEMLVTSKDPKLTLESLNAL